MKCIDWSTYHALGLVHGEWGDCRTAPMVGLCWICGRMPGMDYRIYWNHSDRIFWSTSWLGSGKYGDVTLAGSILPRCALAINYVNRELLTSSACSSQTSYSCHWDSGTTTSKANCFVLKLSVLAPFLDFCTHCE